MTEMFVNVPTIVYVLFMSALCWVTHKNKGADDDYIKKLHHNDVSRARWSALNVMYHLLMDFGSTWPYKNQALGNLAGAIDKRYQMPIGTHESAGLACVCLLESQMALLSAYVYYSIYHRSSRRSGYAAEIFVSALQIAGTFLWLAEPVITGQTTRFFTHHPSNVAGGWYSWKVWIYFVLGILSGSVWIVAPLICSWNAAKQLISTVEEVFPARSVSAAGVAAAAPKEESEEPVKKRRTSKKK
jgi:hypothetical protein